jgi:LytS/YehU family sensor histidine kinase
MFWFSFVKSLGYLCVEFAGFYGSYFFVGPSLFLGKKYVRAAVYFLLTLCAMVLWRYVAEFQIFVPYLKFHNYFWHTPAANWYVWNCISVSFKYCLLGLIVYFIMQSNELQQQKKEAEKEKVQAELSFLQSQINPHFLFNTINDIYALAYQKSDDAPVALLKLSGILRYVLDGSKGEKVLLEKELQYLNNYIELQAIGLKNELYVDYLVTGDASGMLIPPLLLIPFAENIFKHGVISDCSKKATLQVGVTNGTLHLTSRNFIRQQQKDATGGIGLSNVQRRLQLLYAGKHSFSAGQKGNEFICDVRINLT